jgi:hypothetical protein
MKPSDLLLSLMPSVMSLDELAGTVAHNVRIRY